MQSGSQILWLCVMAEAGLDDASAVTAGEDWDSLIDTIRHRGSGEVLQYLRGVIYRDEIMKLCYGFMRHHFRILSKLWRFCTTAVPGGANGIIRKDPPEATHLKYSKCPSAS